LLHVKLGEGICLVRRRLAKIAHGGSINDVSTKNG
jgi:hypothetical protein